MYFNLTHLGTAFQEKNNEMNLIALAATIAVVLTSFALSFCRARLSHTKTSTEITNLTKRLEASEATNAICLANVNALILNLAALHKARIVRNETKRRYNDNRRSAELITATHKAEMNYKQAKDFLSSYVIEATKV
jgi:hypothetical protein